MKRSKVLFPLALAIVLAFGLAGCNGGGGDDDDIGSSNGNGSGGNNPPPQANVSGVVTNYSTGDPVENALVRVYKYRSPTESTVLLEQDRTNADGEYSVPEVGAIDRLVVVASHDGFAQHAVIRSTSASDPAVHTDVAVQEAHLVATFDPAQPKTLSFNGIDLIELTANTFETASGNAPSGQITATVTVIDPSSDPRVLTGGYQAVDSQGNLGLIETWGALNATFAGEAGNEVVFAPGESVTIRIPVAAERNNPPQMISLFFFDETTGIWKQQGSATLSANGQYYVATVDHFTSWNAAEIYPTVTVSGCVVNQAGDRVANARIVANGQTYIGASSVRTNANGEFTIPVHQNSTLLLAAFSGSFSNTIELTVGTQDIVLDNQAPTLNDNGCFVLSPEAVTITLTWGNQPRDLDSHFYGPADASGGQRFEVYYANQEVTIDGSVIKLDVDDTDGFGPEVTTITSFPFPGTYRFLVHKFGGNGTIESSPARVELVIGDQTRVFSPADATGSTTEYWAVFKLIVDSNFNVTVQPIQAWRPSFDRPGSGGSTNRMAVTPSNAAQRAVRQKYYAD